MTRPAPTDLSYNRPNDADAKLERRESDSQEISTDTAGTSAFEPQLQRGNRQPHKSSETALSFDIEMQDVDFVSSTRGAGQANQPSADRPLSPHVNLLHETSSSSPELVPTTQTVKIDHLNSNLQPGSPQGSSLVRLEDETPKSDFPVDFSAFITEDNPDITRRGTHTSAVQGHRCFGIGAICERKIAADLLLVYHCYKDSFPLYLSVLEDWNKDSATPLSKVVSAIIGCARSCTTSFQMHVVRGIVEDIFLQRKAVMEETSENLLCKFLLADILYSQGHYSAGQCCDQSAMQSYFAWDESAQNGNNKKILTPVMEYYLGQTLRRESDSPPTEAFTSLVSHRAAKVQIGSFRSCLQWCIEELTGDQAICNPLGTVLKGAGGASITFSELWWRWTLQMSRNACPWDYGAEHHLGMSPSELLFITCLTMCDAAFTEVDDQDFSNGSALEIVSQQALEGGLKLSNCSDATMARQFQTSFALFSSNTKTPNDRRTTFRSFAPYRDTIMTFIEGTLDLKLSKPPQLNSNNLSRLAHSNARSNLYAWSFGPTIASSLRSSDLESQRALGERISKRVGSLERNSDTRRPLSIMSGSRNSSKGWVASFLSPGSLSTSKSRFTGETQANFDWIAAAELTFEREGDGTDLHWI